MAITNSPPKWGKNNFLDLHMPLFGFILLIIVVILIYCIIVSMACVYARKVQNSKVLKSAAGDVELGVVLVSEQVQVENEAEIHLQDAVLAKPSRARIHSKVKGVMSQVREMGRRQDSLS